MASNTSRLVRLKSFLGHLLSQAVSGRVVDAGGREMPWSCSIPRGIHPDLDKAVLRFGRKVYPSNYHQIFDDILFRLFLRLESGRALKECADETELDGIIERFGNYRDEIRKSMLAFPPPTWGLHSHKRGRVEGKEFLSWLHNETGDERLIVLLTHSCQLRCSYCRVRKYAAEMDTDVLRRSVRFLFTSVRDNLQLQFFGGEPLLRFDLIKKGVKFAGEWSDRTGKKVSYILTTNGLALTPEKLDFLGKHDFCIEFSCDGTLSSQMKTRGVAGFSKAYYRTLMKNLEDLRKRRTPYYVISVATPETVADLFSNFKYFVSLGHKSVQINYSLGVQWNEAQIKELLRQMEQVKRWCKANRDVTFINLRQTRREPVVLNTEPTVDCDGIIYRETGICLEEDFMNMKEKFRIGHIKDRGLDLTSIGTSQVDNFRILYRAYAPEKPEFRSIILNNIRLGSIMLKWVR